MLELNFGHIEDLHVKCGQPQFMPPPRVVQDIVFGRKNDIHPCREKPDFVLKKQVVELFEILEQVDEGIVRSLAVQNGRPVRMKHEKPLRA